MGLKQTALLIMIVFSVLVTSGCIMNSQNNENPENHNSGNSNISDNTHNTDDSHGVTQQGSHTQQNTNQSRKITKLLFRNQFIKVFYIGYDEKLASYSWDFDGIIINTGKYYTVLQIKNIPENTAFQEYSSKKYSTLFKVFKDGDGDNSIVTILFNPTLSLHKKAVVKILKDKKFDGYFVVVPVKSLNLKDLTINIVNVDGLSEKGGYYAFDVKAVLNVKTPLPKIIDLSFQSNSRDIFIKDIEPVFNGEFLLLRIEGTIPDYITDDTQLSIEANVMVHGHKITSVKISNTEIILSMLKKELNNLKETNGDNETNKDTNNTIQISASIETGRTFEMSNKVNLDALNLFKKYSQSDSNVPEESIKESKYILEYTLNVEITSKNNNQDVSIDVYVNDEVADTFNIALEKSGKYVVKLVRYVAIPEHPKIKIDFKTRNEVIYTIKTDEVNIKPERIVTYEFSSDGNTVTVKYKPMIDKNSVISMTDLLNRLSEYVKIENVQSIEDMLSSSREYFEVKVDNSVYLINSIKDLIKLIIDNSDKQIEINGHKVNIINKDKLVQILEDLNDKYFIWDIGGDQKGDEFFNYIPENVGGIILPIGIDPNASDSFISMLIITDTEKSVNVAPFNVFGIEFAVIKDVLSDAKVVFRAYPLSKKSMQYPVIILSYVNIISQPLMNFNSISYYPTTGIASLFINYTSPDISGFKLPIQSGDSYVGTLKYIQNGTKAVEYNIINIDLTKHFGVTPDQLSNTTVTSFIDNPLTFFVNNENHVIVQVQENTYLSEVKLSNNDIIKIEEIPTLPKVDYSVSISDNTITIEISNSPFEHYSFVISAVNSWSTTQVTFSNIKVDDVLASPDSYTIISMGGWNSNTIIINLSDKNKKVQVSYSTTPTGFVIYPILTSMDYLYEALFTSSNFAVIGDYYFFI